MTNTIDFILTNAASELISKVLGGKTLNFTRMAVGDGFSYDTTVAKGYKTLVNEVLSLDIIKKETLSASSARITSVFKNTDAQKEFYYREVGLFAEDPDTGEEILYAYGNRNNAAELITPTGSNVITKQLAFIISVGNSANITFSINANVYALQEDLTTLQTSLHELNSTKVSYVTPEIFGAVGDGNTDDTQAIKDALNADCDIVIFGKNKTYIISEKIYVTKSGKVINGNNATLKIDPSIAENYISNVDNYAFKIYNCDDVHVSNLNIDGSRPFIERTDDTTGNYASNTTLYLEKRENGYSGIGVEKCNRVSVAECTAHHTASGIGMKNVVDGLIKNCKVTYTATDAFPIYHGCKNIYIESCYSAYIGDDALAVYGLKKYWDDDQIEIDVAQPENIHFANCIVTQCRSRGFINNGGKNVFFENCTFDGVMWGFRIAYDSKVIMYSPDNTYINNCYISVTPFDGITSEFVGKINDANNVYVNRTEIKSNLSSKTYGSIYVTGTTNLFCDNIKITNAYFNNDTDTTNQISIVNMIQNSYSYNTFKGVQKLVLKDCEMYNLLNILAYLPNCIDVTVLNLVGDSGKKINCTAIKIFTDNIDIFESTLITSTTNIKLKNPQNGNVLYNGVFDANVIQFMSGIPYYNDGSSWKRPNFVPIEGTKTSGSCNDLYGTNGLKVHIVTASVTEIPTNHNMFIVTIESTGAGLKIQIAIDTSNGALYSRTGTDSWTTA